jgi:hypothetical protein
VSVRQLPDHLVTPRTNIHGPPRYRQDFTDGTHAISLALWCHCTGDDIAEIIRAAQIAEDRPDLLDRCFYNAAE